MAAECFTIFIDKGYRERRTDDPDRVVRSLAEVADLILALHAKRINHDECSETK